VDEAERDRLIAKVAADAAGLVAEVRRERDRRQAAGEDTAWLDTVLAELEPLAQGTHDLVTFRAIRAVVERHGGGPYPAEELAAIAGVTAADARRVLDQMVAEGRATPANQPPDAPQPD
jgi:hypothetical protein